MNSICLITNSDNKPIEMRINEVDINIIDPVTNEVSIYAFTPKTLRKIAEAKDIAPKVKEAKAIEPNR